MIAVPVRYKDDVEQIGPAEDADVAALNASFDRILHRTKADYGHAVRAVHAKSHGILEGEFLVEEGLPPELAQGIKSLFASFSSEKEESLFFFEKKNQKTFAPFADSGRRYRTARIRRAALRPGRPETPPPGCVPAPHMNKLPIGER